MKKKRLRIFDEKLERNIEMYIARKNGETYRSLSLKYNLSTQRVQFITERTEKRIQMFPEMAQLVADRVSKKL